MRLQTPGSKLFRNPVMNHRSPLTGAGVRRAGGLVESGLAGRTGGGRGARRAVRHRVAAHCNTQITYEFELGFVSREL